MNEPKNLINLAAMRECVFKLERENAELIKSRDSLFVHVAKLERENAELRSACELALKVGTSYPNDSRAHIDSYTENALRKALVAKGGKGK